MRLARLGGLVSAIALAATMTACGSSQKTVDVQPSAGAEGGNAGALIGVTMPTKSSERWIHDGDNVKAQLEKLGYKVDLQYAEDDIPTQVYQIENMITKGAKVLIIASIDGTALDLPAAAGRRQQDPGHRLRPADPQQPERRLLRHLRQLQGRRAAGDLAPDRPRPARTARQGHGKGPFNIELFAGSPDDNNATFFWNGAMTILQPLHRRRHPGGQERPDRLRAGRHPALGPGDRAEAHGGHPHQTYADGTKVDGVLSPYDGLSIGILSALEEQRLRHRQTSRTRSSPARTPSSPRSSRSSPASSTPPSSRTPASSPRPPSKMADAVLKGGKPEVNNTKDYDNGNKVVPSYPARPGHRRQGQLQEGPDRLRLLHRAIAAPSKWRAPAAAPPPSGAPDR